VPGSLVSREPRSVALADKSVATATEMGHVLLEFDDAFLRLTSVLLVEELGIRPDLRRLSRRQEVHVKLHGLLRDADGGVHERFFCVCARDPESASYQLPSLLSTSLWPPRTQVFGTAGWRTSTNVTSPPRTSLWMTSRPLAPTTAVAVRADSARLTDCRSRDASHV
jgi:hypothetical protein